MENDEEDGKRTAAAGDDENILGGATAASTGAADDAKLAARISMTPGASKIAGGRPLDAAAAEAGGSTEESPEGTVAGIGMSS